MSSIALNNALTGLRVSQQSLNVLSQNIANANNADYTRQTLNQSAIYLGDEVGSGVQVDSISRQIDQYITAQLVGSNSSVAQSSTVSNFYSQLQTYIGQPGQSNSIDTYVNNFFNSITQLSISPETSSLKINAVSAGSTLATQISSLAKNINTLRFNADSQIKQSVDSVNQSLQHIYQLNAAVLSAKNNNSSVNGLEDSINVELNNISTQMDITYHTDDDGTVSISSTNGVQLIGGGSVSQLSYTPASSVDDFNNNIPSGAITVYQLDASGNKQGTGQQLVSGGEGSSVTSNIKSGNIAGLLQVRDKTMPAVLSQLDNMASAITSSVNAIHNNGSSFPPLQAYTGTTLVDPKATNTWQGSVMIAALDANGQPVKSPYASDVANGNGYAPLTIDLSSLNSGSGKGNPSFQTIIDTINNYYGAPQPRTGLGDLSNIQLHSDSDSLTAGSGTYKFSLDLSSLSANNTTFSVTSATMSGGATLTSNLNNVAVTAGTSVNTNGSINFTADMSSAGPGPYTISLNVQTVGSDGTISNGVVTYTIPNATSGLENNKYAASTASGDAAIETPTTNQGILQAKLVDANGNEIAKDPTTGDYMGSGYLEITGANSSYRVAISQMNSADLGNASTLPPVAATNYGFSQYFGLNNFFTASNQVAGSAINMAVNSNIANNPQNMAVGTLSLSSQPTDSTQKRYTYEIGSGSNQTISSLASLGTQSIKFASAGGLPETTLAFSDYAAEILGDAASKTSDAASDLTQQQLIQQGFSDKDKSIRGVNVDEEMANTILFQNAYSANARVITVAKQLFDDLLQAFQ